MKDWLTAREIAEERLPDLPSSESAMIRLAAREGWDGTAFARPRAGRGGATEYSVSLLPTIAQVTYLQRHMVVDAPKPTTRQAPSSELTARAGRERDARLAIVAAFKRFSAGLRLGYASRVQIFTDRYNAGLVDIAAHVRETVPTISKRSLARWQAVDKAGRTNDLAHDPAAARKGTGILDRANDGRVKAFVLGLLAFQPHLYGGQVRTLCRSEFGDCLTVVSKGVERTVEMPPLRTFQLTLKTWKASHKVELTKLTNPDLFRATMAPAGTGMLAHVREPNQMWQIDASPMDALCIDGRHSVYVCLDLATRRMIVLVSRTPRASAVALLIRKAVLAWGVPDLIKTDNGSDFVARDTQRLFAALAIETDRATAFTPTEKGHVERAIGTLQHSFATLLPGFIGHSVADRKTIESRKAFAARLGETDANLFGVELTAAALQDFADEWAAVQYANTPHEGLGRQTPANAALASIRAIRRVDERALDLLLMPVAGDSGLRTVTKTGVRVNGQHYMLANVLPGTAVFLRQDPADLGRLYAFEEDGGRFLGEAICPALSGQDPKAVAAARKALQNAYINERVEPIRREAKRIAKDPQLIARSLDVARRDAPNVIALPKREQSHTTPQIEAAIVALSDRTVAPRDLTPAEAAMQRRLLAEAEEERLIAVTDSLVQNRLDEIETARTALASDKVSVLPETPKERYRRAIAFRQRADAAPDELRTADAIWLGRYECSAEWRAQRTMHDDFGDAYLS